MREKQRGPDILAKTSCSYQISMFHITAHTIAIGARTSPTLNAITRIVTIKPIPVVNKPMIRPAIMKKPITAPNTFTNPVIIVTSL